MRITETEGLAKARLYGVITAGAIFHLVNRGDTWEKR
jgi:hypothetical protein